MFFMRDIVSDKDRLFFVEFDRKIVRIGDKEKALFGIFIDADGFGFDFTFGKIVLCGDNIVDFKSQMA